MLSFFNGNSAVALFPQTAVKPFPTSQFFFFFFLYVKKTPRLALEWGGCGRTKTAANMRVKSGEWRVKSGEWRVKRGE